MTDEFEGSAEDVGDRAGKHFTSHGGGRRRFREALHLLTAMGRMAKAVASGHYDMATPKFLMMLATLGYVVSPVDAVPEAILGPLGLVDDASLLTATAGVLAYEIACFLDWEAQEVLA